MLSMVTLPYDASSALTVPAGVSKRETPGTSRSRNAMVRMTPMRPWPHMPRYVSLLKKTMPATDPGFTGGVSSAPTIASCPRGSHTTARRR